jgi:hypothetical protein
MRRIRGPDRADNRNWTKTKANAINYTGAVAADIGHRYKQRE